MRKQCMQNGMDFHRAQNFIGCLLVLWLMQYLCFCAFIAGRIISNSGGPSAQRTYTAACVCVYAVAWRGMSGGTKVLHRPRLRR